MFHPPRPNSAEISSGDPMLTGVVTDIHERLRQDPLHYRVGRANDLKVIKEWDHIHFNQTAFQATLQNQHPTVVSPSPLIPDDTPPFAIPEGARLKLDINQQQRLRQIFEELTWGIYASPTPSHATHMLRLTHKCIHRFRNQHLPPNLYQF